MIIIYLMGIGFVIGIIKYLLIPIVTAIKHGLYDGWNGSNNYRSLYINDLETVDNTQAVDDEIAHLESMIDRYNEMSVIIEKELQLCTDNKKRLVLLNRLNTIDNQTYNAHKKIDKLLEKLE